MARHWDWYGNSTADSFLAAVYEVNNEKLCGVNSKSSIALRTGVDTLSSVAPVSKQAMLVDAFV